MTQREEFEAWASKNCYILELDESGDYERDITFSAYEGFKAAKAQAVPDGYRLMPPEPTPEMIEAWRESPFSDDHEENLASGYDAMFLAAPEVSTSISNPMPSGYMLNTLIKFQKWRIGEDDRALDETGLTPRSITEAIDWAIERLDKSVVKSVPDGWKLVPIDPTQEMFDAAFHAPSVGHPETSGQSYGSIYKAMVSAAPEQQK